MDRDQAKAILHEMGALIAVEPEVFDATVTLALEGTLPHLTTRIDERLGLVLVDPHGGELDSHGDMTPFTTLYRATRPAVP